MQEELEQKSTIENQLEILNSTSPLSVAMFKPAFAPYLTLSIHSPEKC